MYTNIESGFKSVTIKSIEEDRDSYESEGKYIVGVLLSMKVSEKQVQLMQYNKKKLHATTYNCVLTFSSCDDEEGKTFCIIFENSLSFRNFVSNMMDFKIGDAIVIYEPEQIVNYLSKENDLPIIKSEMLAFSRKLDKELHLIENIDLTIPEEVYTRFFL